MAKLISLNQPFIFDDFSSGMIDSFSVSESLMPKNAVRKAVNAVFDNPRGAIAGRLGSTLVGASLGSQVRGLYNFRDSGAGTNHRLLATNNTGVTYYLNGASFTSTLSGDTVALKTRFVTFLDVVARLNGTDGVKTWDGSAAWVVTAGPLDVGNWPSGTKFANVFNSRIYTAGNASAPDTLYYSSLPTAGAISWTSGNGSIQINPNDGDAGITGLVTNGTVELIFKRNSIYRWDGSSTFANKIINVGAPSQEAIAAHDSGFVYFLGLGKNTIAAYRTTGGYPQKISQNIERWFSAINPANYSNIAVFCDEDNFYLSVGSVTVDGQTYTNAWFVYTISMQTWHIENRATSFSVFAPYIDATGNVTTVGGDSSGNVQTINSGTTDNGTAISAEVEFNPLLFTTRARVKLIPNVTTYANFWQGLGFYLKADKEDYKAVGEAKKEEQHFNSLSVRGKRIYPKLTVTCSTSAWQFDGMEFNDVVDEGFYN